MKDIAVITKDERLYRKLMLLFGEDARVERLYTAPVSREAYDLVLADTRGERTAAHLSGDEELDILLGYDGRLSADPDIEMRREVTGYVPIVWREEAFPGALPYPFTFAEAEALISDSKNKSARLVPLGDRTVRLDGEKIRLSEIEYKLLSVLIAGGGDFISRDALIAEVWGEGQDAGVLNVYIHYLREKIERGEKIILSSRGGGYRINAAYLGGRNA